MTADRKGKYHDAGREVTYLSHDKTPRLIRVLKVCVGQSSVPTLADSEDFRRAFRFLGPQLGTASRAALSRRQIEYAGAVTGVNRFEQRARARELDVVT